MTPSFEKRLRRNAGNRATFNFNNKTRSIVVKDVIWNSETKSYTLRSTNGVKYPTKMIQRPVRYSF